MIKKIFYGVVGITTVYIMWKVATYDWCQVWYGIKCLPPF